MVADCQQEGKEPLKKIGQPSALPLPIVSDSSLGRMFVITSCDMFSPISPRPLVGEMGENNVACSSKRRRATSMPSKAWRGGCCRRRSNGRENLALLLMGEDYSCSEEDFCGRLSLLMVSSASCWPLFFLRLRRLSPKR